MKGTSQGGEIVQVKGGHILRSTGRKDRHSKVYTSKGPRDRRVRLSAHTAIQFYDVQDRLGYDRPSKAVDWLIKKAKTAIDKLGVLPSWQPVNDTNQAANTDGNGNSNPGLDQHSDTPSGFGLTQGSNANNNPGSSNSSFMAPPADQADDVQMVNTMRSFFPTSSLNSFPGFTIDSVPRGGFQGEELGLSLHTENGNSENIFQECYQRINSWNSGGVEAAGRVGFAVNSQQAIFSQGLGFSPRDLLQSNLGDQSWNQRSLASMNQQNPQPCGSQYSDFGNPFDFGYGITDRIYGEEEPESPV